MSVFIHLYSKLKPEPVFALFNKTRSEPERLKLNFWTPNSFRHNPWKKDGI